jgi:hypothetical protein
LLRRRLLDCVRTYKSHDIKAIPSSYPRGSEITERKNAGRALGLAAKGAEGQTSGAQLKSGHDSSTGELLSPRRARNE